MRWRRSWNCGWERYTCRFLPVGETRRPTVPLCQAGINSGGIVAGKGKCYGVHRGYSMTSEIRKSNFKLLVSTFAFILFASGAVHAETSPSKEISLADWCLKNPSEIGYVSIGVLHKKEGDELIIYDIRKQRPVVKEPKRPRRRIPSFKGDVFFVSHFN